MEFVYKVDNLYDAQLDRSVRYDDPAIQVDWGFAQPVLSKKDLEAPFLRDSDCNFTFGEG